MTVTAVAPHAGRHESPAPTSPFTGVGKLIRLALRRDRVRLSVWIASLTLMMVYAPNAIKLAYPEEAQRAARVNLLKTPQRRQGPPATAAARCSASRRPTSA